MSSPNVKPTQCRSSITRANIIKASRRLLSGTSPVQRITSTEEVRDQQESNLEEEFTDSREEEVEGLFLYTEAAEPEEDKYTFPVAVFYGNTKSNYDSFFKPIVRMFENLSVNPIEVKQDGQIVATANIYSVMTGGDMVEVNSLLRHMGAVCFYGCRFCDVRGGHPGDKSTSNGGMYFSGPKGNDRTKESLLLNKSSFSNDECYGIKGKTVFLNLAHSLEYFGFDELHCYSNLAKQLFEMFSPSSNERYKYEGNEHLYPFSISKDQYKAVQHAINSSPNGSFAGQSFDNQKGNYRSVDWISWLVHIVPLLIAPFCPPDCKDAISVLCHGLQVSLQWCITSEDLHDIKNSFCTWFNYLNKCLAQKMISRTVFRANMHLLLHVPYIIRRMGITYKFRISLHIVFALSVFEKYGKRHWHTPTLGAIRKQLQYRKLKQEIDLEKVVYSVISPHFFGQEMIIAPKLWCDNTVYSSDLSMRSNKNTTKKGEYIMFSATKRNALKKVETRYYFARILFFFSFQYNSDGPGSHFCFAELAQSQEAAYFNTAIPTVSFVKVGTRDHVIFDACDIETLVGLVYRPKRDVLTELSSHQMVIRPEYIGVRIMH
ncbi:hypothetical protein BD770DRAFT_432846 [Pilaira anomala]|nr:hypothetical protein BD770DRAFT_432846 [Pilaira anomala]